MQGIQPGRLLVRIDGGGEGVDDGFDESPADADDDQPADFITPALFRDGMITVCVSARSPALSALIRDSLAQTWRGGWSRMADAMQSLRPELRRDSRISTDERRTILRDLATSDAVDVLESGGMPDTIQVTRPVYEKLKDEFVFEPRGLIEIKGRGSVEAWLLRL